MSTLPIPIPKWRSLDANGNPLAGGKLYSYAAGTTTPLNTFTTRAGNVANANPVILNANGEADVWGTQGVLYKLVLKDASDVTQWTVDNIPVGTQEATTSTDLTSSIDPGGRLTLTSGLPLTTADVTAAATVFYTPYNHTKIPLYDGSTWALSTITELSQALSDTTKSPAAATASHVYDMFIWMDAGTLRLSRGPPWSSNTSRGTGGGTTELTKVDGRRLNTNSISNGPAALRGLYVGTIRVSSDGVYDSMSRRNIWNAHNRIERAMQRVETTTSWTYSTAAWRQANNSGLNSLETVRGLDREPVSAEVFGAVSFSDTTSGAGVGIGIDSVTASSAAVYAFADGTVTGVQRVRATYEGYPGVGWHFLAWLEHGAGDLEGFPTETWLGASAPSYGAGPYLVGAPYSYGIWGTVFA